MNFKKYLFLSIMLLVLLCFSLSGVIMMDSVLWQVCFVAISLILFISFVVCVCKFGEYKQTEKVEQQIKRVEDLLKRAIENDVLEGCSFRKETDRLNEITMCLKEDYSTAKMSMIYISFGLNKVENELIFLVEIQEIALKIREYWNKIKSFSGTGDGFPNPVANNKSHTNIREQYSRVIETLSSPIFLNDTHKLNYYLTILEIVKSDYQLAFCDNQSLAEGKN